MTNTLRFFCNGAVGFIVWLGLSRFASQRVFDFDHLVSVGPAWWNGWELQTADGPRDELFGGTITWRRRNFERTLVPSLVKNESERHRNPDRVLIQLRQQRRHHYSIDLLHEI